MVLPYFFLDLAHSYWQLSCIQQFKANVQNLWEVVGHKRRVFFSVKKTQYLSLYGNPCLILEVVILSYAMTLMVNRILSCAYMHTIFTNYVSSCRLFLKISSAKYGNLIVCGYFILTVNPQPDSPAPAKSPTSQRALFHMEDVYNDWCCVHPNEKDLTFLHQNSYSRIDLFAVDKLLPQQISSSTVSDISERSWWWICVIQWLLSPWRRRILVPPCTFGGVTLTLFRLLTIGMYSVSTSGNIFTLSPHQFQTALPHETCINHTWGVLLFNSAQEPNNSTIHVSTLS